LSEDEINQLKGQKFRDPNKVARFMAGVTPRVDFGARGIKSGESLLVEMEFVRDDLPVGHFKFAPEAERIGRRYLYATQRGIVSISSDASLSLADLVGDVQYQTADGGTDKFGDVRIRRSAESKAIVLDFEGVQRNSFFLIPTYWKPI
jgi:hypothetical protein